MRHILNISLALTFEPVFPENRLLSVLLLILNLLAASETLGVSQEHRNAIASSIAFIVVEISHLKVVSIMDCGGVHCSGVCTIPGNLLPGNLLPLKSGGFTYQPLHYRNRAHNLL
jgi:hypothetical protein